MRLPVDPTSYALRAPFGFSWEYYKFTVHHSGQDFSGQYNRRVYAAHGGKVTSGYDDRNGHYLVVDNGKYRSSYLHLKSGSKRVKQNETVSEGKWIATMGTTGKSTGVHLHWSLRVDGKLVDPMKYVTKGDNMTRKQLHDIGTAAYRLVLHREPREYGDAVKLGKRFNKNAKEAFYHLKENKEWVDIRKKVKGYSGLSAAYDNLQKDYKTLEQENAALKTRVGVESELNAFGRALAALLKSMGFKREE